MTTLGKILIFFVLAFSLLVGALVIFDYSARTHWAAGYEELKNRYTVSEKSNKAYYDENQALLAQLAAKDKEIKDAKAKLQADLDKERDNVTDLTKKLAAEKKTNNEREATATASLEETKLRQADVDKLRTTLKAETDRNIRLVEDRNKERDRAVAAEIQFKSVNDRNQQLEVQLRDLARDLARQRSGGGAGTTPARANRNPPSESVEGLIKNTDPSGLVTITIGTDAGVTRGHTMEVFRLGPLPRYLGTIRILEASHNQAVGQPVGRMVSPPQAGDRVASRIVGG